MEDLNGSTSPSHNSPDLVTPTSAPGYDLPLDPQSIEETVQAVATTTVPPNDAKVPLRSSKGCYTCRARKVRCDEQKPICAKCSIKHRSCTWPDPDAPPPKRTLKKRGPPLSLDSLFASTSSAFKKPSLPGDNTNDVWTNALSQFDHGGPTISPSLSQPPAPIPSSISPETINFFSVNVNQDTSPLPNLALWMNQYDTPPFPANPFEDAPSSDLTSTQVPAQPLLHPLPSLEDIASWTLPTTPNPPRFYVPPDFLPKSLSLGPGKPKISLLPPKTKARMMADPGFMQPYFPALDDRLIMRHYLLHTVHVIMAFECDRQPWNPWVKYHAPLAFAHLPGVNPACDALRAAILAVGGVHLRHERYPNDQKAALKLNRASTAKVLELVRQVIDNQAIRPLQKEDIEFIVAALLSCTVASSLAADGAWSELLSSVVDFMDRLGGAASLLQDSPRDKMTAMRFCCEQLAIRDVFGCFSTQAPPRILDTAFKPWFFEAEAWSCNDDEWESVERMFGISRGMIDVMARACGLIHKVQSTGQTLPEDAASVRSWTSREGVSLRLPVKAKARLSSNGLVDITSEISVPKPAPPLASREALLVETEALVAEMTVWDQASNFTPVHPRTQYANHAYRHAIRIRILREVFGASRRDARVQTSTKAIIELAVEVVAKFGKVSWLTWPVVIAGFHLFPNDQLRKVVSTLLTEFRRYSCFDAGAALDLLKDFWREDALASTGSIPTQAVARLMSKPFLD